MHGIKKYRRSSVDALKVSPLCDMHVSWSFDFDKHITVHAWQGSSKLQPAASTQTLQKLHYLCIILYAEMVCQHCSGVHCVMIMRADVCYASQEVAGIYSSMWPHVAPGALHEYGSKT